MKTDIDLSYFDNISKLNSLEISGLFNKRHDLVKKDIENMFKNLDINSKDYILETELQKSDGKKEQILTYDLPKVEATVLLSGYNIKLRKEIVDKAYQSEEKTAGSTNAEVTEKETQLQENKPESNENSHDNRNKMTKQKYIEYGIKYNIEPAKIKAVADIESRGSGFLSNGQPVILFEAHIFSRLTGRRYDSTHPHISSRRWNRKLYKGGTREHDRLEQAVRLDRNAALQSASWGAFQIMGFNYKLCGKSTVQEFINAVYKDELSHYELFFEFIKNTKLINHLKTENWAAFARGYNGPGYSQNKYDTKLKQAYIKNLEYFG